MKFFKFLKNYRPIFKATCQGLLTICTLFFLTNCARIEYRSKNSIPIYFSTNMNSTEVFEIEKKLQFFVWGLSPGHHYVDVDSILMANGVKEASKLHIHEFMNWTDKLVSVITLGLFVPYRIKLSGLMLKKGEG
ncbi:MAG: hypothetical protein U0T83_10655 [Bacteriovoracaceae bacterium]